MIAKPGQRNRLMQKLKAETWIRRKNGIWAEMTKVDQKRRRFSLGTLSPGPWDFLARMPIPVK